MMQRRRGSEDQGNEEGVKPGTRIKDADKGVASGFEMGFGLRVQGLSSRTVTVSARALVRNMVTLAWVGSPKKVSRFPLTYE
jgi:hypothetical protein